MSTRLVVNVSQVYLPMYLTESIKLDKVCTGTYLIASLTHYQTANLRLFQTERVCRQQFQI